MRNSVLFAELADSGIDLFDEDRLSKLGGYSHARNSGMIVRTSGKRLWMP
ncbi:MAG: hypothetical protein ACXWTY_17995 [Methylobacter sp.]